MAKINWKKIHSYQETDDWCGPAVVQMVLLAAGIKNSQKEIAKDITNKWWGTGQNIMMAYLSRHFKLVNFKINATLKDIKYHLGKGHIIVVNWWDDTDDDLPDGHYTIIADYLKKNRKIIMVDPSGSRKGLWKMDFKEFRNRWYDYLDVHGNTWVDGWMLWVDPKKIVSVSGRM